MNPWDLPRLVVGLVLTTIFTLGGIILLVSGILHSNDGIFGPWGVAIGLALFAIAVPPTAYFLIGDRYGLLAIAICLAAAGYTMWFVGPEINAGHTSARNPVGDMSIDWWRMTFGFLALLGAAVFMFGFVRTFSATVAMWAVGAVIGGWILLHGFLDFVPGIDNFILFEVFQR